MYVSCHRRDEQRLMGAEPASLRPVKPLDPPFCTASLALPRDHVRLLRNLGGLLHTSCGTD